MRRKALLAIATALVWCGTAIGQDIEPSSMPGDGIASEQQQPLTLFKDSYFGQPKAEVLAAGAERIEEDGNVFYIKRNISFAGQRWDSHYTFLDSDTLAYVTLYSYDSPERKAINAARTLVKSGFYPLSLSSGDDEMDFAEAMTQGMMLMGFRGTDDDISSLALQIRNTPKGKITFLENTSLRELVKGFRFDRDFFALIPERERFSVMEWVYPADDTQGYISINFAYMKLMSKALMDDVEGGKEDF